ncbi:MAG: thiolase family protein [Actinobacteria bacterium]|nr:thiolase family protein [Actinomycetota bacterium]MBU1944040.1 thiolase family protein [Actinomycetota bacterium]MBU2688536.1 thiolase family protein [Actinomycetota bacterium]
MQKTQDSRFDPIYIIGVGMIKFGKFYDRNMKSMAAEAVNAALSDAGLEKEDLQAAWVGNAAQGFSTGQECIRGQVVLRSLGIERIPVVNVENACATGSTALHGAWMGIRAGLYDCALVLGMEKMAQRDPARVFMGFFAGTDVEAIPDLMDKMSEWNRRLDEEMESKGVSVEGVGATRSGAMDIYSIWARHHMARYGSTREQLAMISAKNHWHSSMNPFAQYRYECTPEEVLADKEVCWPLTRYMCAPIGDGAAAAVVCSSEYLKRLNGVRPVRVRATVLASGSERDLDDEEDIVSETSRRAYETAGLGPDDVDLAEMHDATAFGELHQTEAVGFCPVGEGGELAESGATRLGGRIPVNTSGGLESRGHPIGATGVAMLHELTTQLRGEAGPRQVEGARIGMSVNGGGIIGMEEASLCVNILEGVG